MHELKPALCLDWDGTIRYSKTGRFINGPQDIALFPDVEEKLWQYREDGYLIFGISNQGGVAYGLKTPHSNDQEIAATLALFERNPFHLIKMCFHHPGGHRYPYNHRSLLRKPDYGMLALCEVEAWEMGFIVNWDKSLMVGDRSEDEVCARAVSIQFVRAAEFFGRMVG